MKQRKSGSKPRFNLLAHRIKHLGGRVHTTSSKTLTNLKKRTTTRRERKELDEEEIWPPGRRKRRQREAKGGGALDQGPRARVQATREKENCPS